MDLRGINILLFLVCCVFAMSEARRMAFRRHGRFGPHRPSKGYSQAGHSHRGPNPGYHSQRFHSGPKHRRPKVLYIPVETEKEVSKGQEMANANSKGYGQIPMEEMMMGTEMTAESGTMKSNSKTPQVAEGFNNKDGGFKSQIWPQHTNSQIMGATNTAAENQQASSMTNDEFLEENKDIADSGSTNSNREISSRFQNDFSQEVPSQRVNIGLPENQFNTQNNLQGFRRFERDMVETNELNNRKENEGHNINFRNEFSVENRNNIDRQDPTNNRRNPNLVETDFSVNNRQNSDSNRRNQNLEETNFSVNNKQDSDSNRRNPNLGDTDFSVNNRQNSDNNRRNQNLEDTDFSVNNKQDSDSNRRNENLKANQRHFDEFSRSDNGASNKETDKKVNFEAKTTKLDEAEQPKIEQTNNQETNNGKIGLVKKNVPFGRRIIRNFIQLTIN